MVLKSILKLFGVSREVAQSPESLRTVQLGAVRPHDPMTASSMPKKVLVREEILDARCRISGYRYRLEKAGVATKDYLDALQRGERVKEFAKTRLAVIRLDLGQWSEADFASLVGANTLFEIVVPPSLDAGEDWTPLLDEIRSTGAGIAMAHDAALKALGISVEHLKLVFFDLEDHLLEDFELQVKAFKHHSSGIRIAVENISSWAEQRFTLSLGAQYSLGNFVDTKDETAESGTINQSRTIILEMLSQLRADGSLKDLAQVAKRDPATSLQLLTMANSPLSGFSRQLASIDQAIMTLGKEALYRWLTMALFRSGGDTPRMNALLEHALYRARLLELVGGQTLQKKDCDELFLIGLLSYTDVLLDIPMSEVLHRMQVVEEVRSALLKNGGRLTPYLDLVKLMQRGSSDRLVSLSQSLRVGHEELLEFHAAALEWAGTMMEA